jgi:septum formation protein
MTGQDKLKLSLYLASASPRRRELLAQLGLATMVLPQHIDESVKPREPAADYVCRVALEKVQAALRDPGYRLPLPVLAADTSVVCDGKVLGKPQHLEEAVDMLTRLSGCAHQVLTAVAIATPQLCKQVLVTTMVSFRTLTADEIRAYWYSGEPCDKAGAYAIQGLGAMFVSRIEGSYSSVVGLPLFETMQLLANFGITADAVLRSAVDEC